MTALSQDASRPVREGEVVSGVPLAAGANVRMGSLLEIDGSGRVAPATKAASKTYYGVAESAADNTGGAAGALKVDVRTRGCFHFAKAGTAGRGKDAYALDDNTVTDVSTAATKCGRIIDVDADGVWVDLEF